MQSVTHPQAAAYLKPLLCTRPLSHFTGSDFKLTRRVGRAASSVRFHPSTASSSLVDSSAQMIAVGTEPWHVPSKRMGWAGRLQISPEVVAVARRDFPSQCLRPFTLEGEPDCFGHGSGSLDALGMVVRVFRDAVACLERFLEWSSPVSGLNCHRVPVRIVRAPASPSVTPA